MSPTPTTDPSPGPEPRPELAADFHPRPFIPTDHIEAYGVVRPRQIAYLDSDGIPRQMTFTRRIHGVDGEVGRVVVRDTSGRYYMELTVNEVEYMTDRPVVTVTLGIHDGDDTNDDEQTR